jgi:5-methyltetrahydropteroyltriglutamate--homocysteine methyltransferase
MPNRSTRVLTTHVGSLIRPPQLVEYIKAIEGGVTVNASEFESGLARSVTDIVEQQAKRSAAG